MKTKYIIDNDQRLDNAVDAVTRIPVNGRYEVIIQHHVKSKTIEQRGWFHKLCKIFGDEVGYTQEDIKQLVKKEALGVKIVSVGHNIVEVVRSSESIKIDEYAHLIDTCYRLAAEAGIYLPPPAKEGLNDAEARAGR